MWRKIPTSKPSNQSINTVKLKVAALFRANSLGTVLIRFKLQLGVNLIVGVATKLFDRRHQIDLIKRNEKLCPVRGVVVVPN